MRIRCVENLIKRRVSWSMIFIVFKWAQMTIVFLGKVFGNRRFLIE